MVRCRKTDLRILLFALPVAEIGHFSVVCSAAWSDCRCRCLDRWLVEKTASDSEEGSLPTPCRLLTAATNLKHCCIRGEPIDRTKMSSARRGWR